MGPRVYMRMSCANGCVVVLDWYLSRAFFRSGVSGADVLMHALCLFDGSGVCCRCIRCTRGVCPCWAGWYGGWRFIVKSATYLVLLDVVGNCCGTLC